jgi:hypothetical protein
VELSEQEPESDEDVEGPGRVEIVDSSTLIMKPCEIVTLSPQRSSSHSSSSDSSSSSNNSSEGELQTATDKSTLGGTSAHQASARSEDSEGSGSQFESDAYFVSTENPIDVAAELNALGAKLIGGLTIGEPSD